MRQSTETNFVFYYDENKVTIFAKQVFRQCVSTVEQVLIGLPTVRCGMEPALPLGGVPNGLCRWSKITHYGTQMYGGRAFSHAGRQALLPGACKFATHAMTDMH